MGSRTGAATLGPADCARLKELRRAHEEGNLKRIAEKKARRGQGCDQPSCQREVTWACAEDHIPHEGDAGEMPVSRPNWCHLVTRVVDQNSQEALFCARTPALSTRRGGEFQTLKARIVLQGHSARSKSGVSPSDLCAQVANKLASESARCALAAAVVTNKEATLRDAGQAFLQSRIALWEQHLDGVLARKGLWAVESAPGVYSHKASRSALIMYVDDALMISVAEDRPGLWKDIDVDVMFQAPPAEVGQHGTV